MKFLSITRMMDSAILCPPATMRQLLAATLAWADAQMKADKLLECYALPRRGDVTICEYPFVEEAAQNIATIL